MTNVVEFDGGRALIERQAREWLIRLDGTKPLSQAEKVALREWINRSDFHREELTRIAKFWEQANVLTELAVPLGRAASERTDSDTSGKPLLVVAATAVIAIVALVWGLPRIDRTANGTYGTAIGRQQTIGLPDGSSLQLNTDTQVQVSYSDQVRKIRLLRGEAYFNVKPDVRRPFEVTAGDSVVRAVGTSFAVRLEPSAIDVTVTTGAVDVVETASEEPTATGEAPRSRTLAPGPKRVRAGQTSVLHIDGHEIDMKQLPEPELKRRLSWQEGYLVFSGEPLSEVIEEVNRYSPVTLQIGDARLASVPIGGRFKVGELDAVLDVLHTQFGIHSRQVDERNIRLESEPRDQD